MQNTWFVPAEQPNKHIPGDVMETKTVKVGQTTIRVYRPELTEAERTKRINALHRAIAECYRAVAR